MNKTLYQSCHPNIIIISALTLLLLLTISLGSSPVLKRAFHGDASETDSEELSSHSLEILTGSNVELVSTMINDEHIKELLPLLQNLDIPREEKRKHNKMFIDCLTSVKGGEKAAFLWMKENLYQETCQVMLDDLDYSGTFLQTTVIWLKDSKGRFCNCSSTSNALWVRQWK